MIPGRERRDWNQISPVLPIRLSPRCHTEGKAGRLRGYPSALPPGYLKFRQSPGPRKGVLFHVTFTWKMESWENRVVCLFVCSSKETQFSMTWISGTFLREQVGLLVTPWGFRQPCLGRALMAIWGRCPQRGLVGENPGKVGGPFSLHSDSLWVIVNSFSFFLPLQFQKEQWLPLLLPPGHCTISYGFSIHTLQTVPFKVGFIGVWPVLRAPYLI